MRLGISEEGDISGYRLHKVVVLPCHASWGLLDQCPSLSVKMWSKLYHTRHVKGPSDSSYGLK